MFVDFALILEHSYFLHQEMVQNPIEASAKQYTSSRTSDRVAKALTMLYPQYKPQKEEKEKMAQLIMDLISEYMYHLWAIVYMLMANYWENCSQE